jgi:RND family efflux transporter MFP subunit
MGPRLHARISRLPLSAAVLWTALTLSFSPGRAAAPANESTFDGLLLPGQTALIKSKFDERVEAVAVRPGDPVRAGQTLLRFADGEQKAARARTAATLDQAKANLRRIRGVHEKQGASDDELERAETALKLAEADAEMARVQLEERNVRAPFDGVVAERHVDAGTWVETGEALVKVTSLSPLRVEALLPESVLPGLARRSTVRVSLAYPDTTLLLPFRLGAVVVDPASGTFPLRIEVDNTKRRLTPGVSCRITAPGAGKKPS